MTEVELDLGHLKLAGLSWGREGPLVVLLHGWLDNAASFAALAPFLDRGRFLALDWPGHGRSQHRANTGAYHFVDYVHDLDCVLDHLGEPVHLVGHSLGALAAAAYAGTFAEKPLSLTLIEAMVPISAPAEEAPAILRKAIESRRATRDRARRPYPALDTMVRARAQAGGFGFELARPLVERAARAVPGGFEWRSDRRLRTFSPLRLTREQALALVAGIRCPTQAILGEGGYLAQHPQRVAEDCAALGEHELHWLPGGHHLHLEHPEPVAKLIYKMIT
ncbi:alpha/beta fold hydrolase [Gallaecimonas sp. GXIMD4217]|uniref:alpha/beta fold hydrolase n=1 Tax=Gallaecimonas sp. GXIMD4217 TaxID=3131927 RepID=UPI00311B17F8